MAALSLPATMILLAAGVAAAVFCGWRGALPSDPVRGPRLVPWRALMIAFVMLAFLMLVHLANLAGIETGRR